MLTNIIMAKKTWTVGQPISFMWLPGGRSTITASYGRGKQNVPIELCVHCDADSAKAVQASFESIKGANPRRPPYGCIEHRAEERAFEPLKFSWKDDPEPAIYCECEPSELGARNVNGKIHTSFSPTFDTDADYGTLECSGCGSGLGKCQCGEAHVFRFKTGARGSAANPARVTRLDHQSVGSLTNWPAFKDILPVAASEPQGVVTAAGTSEGAKKGWEARHTWTFNVHSEKHGGPGAQLAVDALKGIDGVRAEKRNSPFVHHEQIHVEAKTLKHMEGALKELKDYGYIDDLKDSLAYEVQKATDATSPLATLKARCAEADAAVEAIKARRTVEERIVDEGRVECGDGLVMASWSDAARLAALASRRAHAASHDAQGSSDFSLHRAATEAHREAADAHQNASEEADKERPMQHSAISKYHAQQAASHGKTANHHSNLAEKFDT